MKHIESLRVLGLTESSTLQDLTTSFRKLVKKFHPDLNQDKQEWSNRQMLFLNEAYNTAFEYLSQPKHAPCDTIREKKIKTSKTNEKNISFEKAIPQSIEYLLDGLGLYYQYGLDNNVLRREGTRRTRFRSSIRRIKKSFAILQPIGELHLNRSEFDQLEIIVNFIRHFYKSIHIENIRAANSSIYEMKAFRHFTLGSKLIDCVIKEVMFKEFVEQYKLGRLNENIKLAEAELNSVIIDYPEAICLKDSIIKKELLLSFLDMTNLNEQGLINLYD